MTQLKNYREVGIFDLLSAPLNPIGAFDAEQFKKDARKLIDDNPDDKFVAVDLTGLDFVYSDAYNAFVQFQSELSSKGGMLALLSNSPSIADGLRKAGLDRSLKVFSFEAEMMSFSLHSRGPAESPAAQEPAPAAPVEPEPSPVASQNGSMAESDMRSERRTSHNRRFTKSFNAVVKDEKKLAAKGMNMPFEEESSSGKTVFFIILILLLLGGGLAAYFLM
ncbi:MULTISPECIES: STAS domain-containing protein [Fibrobacter]|uniref:STAS domain-containing protein n=1 Tax=Fibrobacter TaxID=832 RepID=UPI0015659F48|nr:MULTISPECIES: STAS domain-containing protein [Fibrobacter]MBR4783971.1 anti-sigma factor antagonist [Fibrobacter sp.]